MPPEQSRSARQSPSPRARGNKNAWVGLVLVLGLAATGAFVVWGWPHSTSAGENSAEATLTLETFVVNLNESGQRAYLRVGITLGLAHPLSPGKAGVAPTALVRDTILSVLATAQADDLLKIEGKRQLKDELLKALQDRVPEMAVEHVYFTEFLVQM